jgi:hypothetical protein
LQIFLFDIMNAPAGFSLIDEILAWEGGALKPPEELKVHKAQLGTKGPEVVDIAHTSFRPPPFERLNELSKTRELSAGSVSYSVSSTVLRSSWNYGLGWCKNSLEWAV